MTIERSSANGPSWLAFTLAPLAVAGGLFLLSRSSRGPDVVNTPSVVPAPPSEVRPPSVVTPSSPPAASSPPIVPSLFDAKKPRRPFLQSPPPVQANEPCHISSMQMSAVVEANKARVLRCFERAVASFPADVGLSSSWEIAVDGAGRVHTARGELHLIDSKRGAEARAQNPIELPRLSPMWCASTMVRLWKFPAYSAKDGARMLMKCSFNLTIKDR